MARRHQIAPAVFPDPHQILGRFLIDDRDRRRGDLVQTQQPGQMQSVTGIGLDSVPSGFVQLRRADLTPDPAAMSPWSTHSAASMNDVDIDRVPGRVIIRPMGDVEPHASELTASRASLHIV